MNLMCCMLCALNRAAASLDRSMSVGDHLNETHLDNLCIVVVFGHRSLYGKCVCPEFLGRRRFDQGLCRQYHHVSISERIGNEHCLFQQGQQADIRELGKQKVSANGCMAN